MLAAFALYRSTLLPGVDLGDSGSFQTMAGSPLVRPRDGYPLYFAIGALFLRIADGDPAHALNLTSAIEAAIACGLFVVVAAELSASLSAAAAAALLFMVSYTFWSQAVTAEVYALHMAAILATLLFLFRWEQRQSIGRLAMFFAAYAIAFGNHLSMILLLPGLTVYLLLSSADGWRSLLRWRVVALAIAIAFAGAMQYLWNLRTLWFMPDPPASIVEAATRFWVDVTKADWRETLVMSVPQSMVRDHLSMFWFDLRQQFGLPGILTAVAGAVALAATNWRRALLLVLLYAANVAFAFTYNVGDAHVFYLPAHLIVALYAAVGVAAAGRLLARATRCTPACAAAAVIVYAAARGYGDYPALDRSHDRRAADLLAVMTRDLDDRRAILLADLNWQLANGLSYYTKSVDPAVAVGRMRDVLSHAPALVHDNAEIGRRVVVTPPAAQLAAESFDRQLAVEPDGLRIPLREVVGRVEPGTRYVLCVLKPTRDFALDAADVADAIRALSGGRAASPPAGDYAAIAGVAGQPPSLTIGSNFPFAERVEVDGVPVDIRMESWLASDTIRRMGFGHVIARHRHTLIVERGVSFVAFDGNGEPLRTVYFAGLFAEPQRSVLRPR